MVTFEKIWQQYFNETEKMAKKYPDVYDDIIMNLFDGKEDYHDFYRFLKKKRLIR